MKKASETIFDGKFCVIPMDDVSHIEKIFIKEGEEKYHHNIGKNVGDLKSIRVITKHTTWNSEQDEYNNAIWLNDNEANEFLKSWCYFRSEIDK